MLQGTLQGIEQYTHIAFTSRNGIQAVLDALGALTCDSKSAARLLNNPSIQCCALGADAELLYQAGISNVLSPKEVSQHYLSAQTTVSRPLHSQCVCFVTCNMSQQGRGHHELYTHSSVP